MSDSLLPYYERELDAIKRLAAEFADTHPKIAGRLRLSADAVDDPHVSRLLEFVCQNFQWVMQPASKFTGGTLVPFSCAGGCDWDRAPFNTGWTTSSPN